MLIRALLVLVLTIVWSAEGTLLWGVEQRSNVLLILIDDLGWPALGCYGNQHVQTKNIDRLAAEGMRFTDAYAEPQCTPTRAALLTGQHPARNGIWHVIPWYGYPWAKVREPPFVERLSSQTFNIAKGLRQAGYKTACLGKWHLTHGDDGNYVGLDPAAGPAFGFDIVAPNPAPDYHKTGDKGVDYLTDQAIQFIEDNRNTPFFCYLSHHTIHGPVLAPDSLVKKYRERGHPAVGLNNATYLAALEHMDRSIGRLMKRLGELNLTRQTLVIFVSDNGGVDSRYDHRPFQTPSDPPHRLTVNLQEFDNAPLRMGKGSAYEGGIRVPWIMRWPGVVPAGSTCETPVHVIDILPTLMEAAGASVPRDHPLDGRSLLPLLRRAGVWKERSLHWYLPLYDVRWGLTPCAVVRRGEWKLIEHFGDRFDADGRYIVGRHVELFNLKHDLGEQHDCTRQHPDVASKLQQDLHAWMQKLPVSSPSSNPNYDARRALMETHEKPK